MSEEKYSHTETLLHPPTVIPHKPIPKKLETAKVCPNCRTGLEEWVCIQEGGRFGLHTMRCFACGYEKKVE